VIIFSYHQEQNLEVVLIFMPISGIRVRLWCSTWLKRSQQSAMWKLSWNHSMGK